MKVLVACEFSGVVRDAFIAKGHDAISCDFDMTETEGPHYQGDVMDIINNGWDMLIAFPPCTYLASSGAQWHVDRIEEQKLALQFVVDLMNAPIPKICIENPVGILTFRVKKPTQYIQPYQFGHGVTKKTCLWLWGLPKLVPTNIVPIEKAGYIHMVSRTSHRSRDRSRTFKGIAEAMADQWG